MTELKERMGYSSHSSLVDWENGHRMANEEVVRKYERALAFPNNSLVKRAVDIVGKDWDAPFRKRRRSRSHLTGLGLIRSVWEDPILQLYGSILHEVTYEEPGKFTEVTRYIYRIAEDEQDVVIEEHETTVHGPEPMRWRHFGPGALPGSGGVNSYDDLRLKVWCNDSRRVAVLPLNGTELRVELVAFFLPPVASQTITWYVEYVWPGLWNSLRAQGRDGGRLGFRSFTTRAEILLVPPRADWRLTFATRDPEVGDVSTELWNPEGIALPGARWGVGDPNGALRFTVSRQIEAEA